MGANFSQREFCWELKFSKSEDVPGRSYELTVSTLMPHLIPALLRLAGFVGIAVLGTVSTIAAQSSWVYYGLDGKLAYQTWGNGNRIMDFSHAGYMGGGVALPNVATVQTLNPSGGDDRTAIQNAINAVASLPLVNGFRGALQLGPGTFLVSGQLNINASGVVVRGSGSGPGGTILQMTSASTMTLFSIAGSGSPSESGTVNITDAYVASGTNTLTVTSTSGFNVGDNVLVRRKVTTNWIAYLGMDQLVRDGATQTWITAGSTITTDRTVKQVSGNQLVLDAPLTDSFDSVYLGDPVGTVGLYTWSGRISQVGLEHLRIEAPAVATAYVSVNMNNLIDSWARDIVIQDGVNCFTLQKNTKRVTIDEVIITHTVPSTAAAGPSDFACTGTQVLFNKCQALGVGSWPFVTHTTGTGPIVVLNFLSSQHAGISPHQRWCTGVLADHCELPDAPSQTQGIAYRNRGTAGSGHGWTTGWSVAWNVTTPFFLVSAAPGTENWCIGGIGTMTSRAGQGDPDGIYDSLGTNVTLGPTASLYLEQLRERLGNQALANIGYESFLAVSPAAATAPSGGANVNYTVTVSTNTGFSGTVSLGVNGLPAGASAAYAPPTLTNAGSSTLTVTTTGATPLGSYTLTLTATNGAQFISNSVTLIVAPNFQLSAAPDSRTLPQGAGTSFTVTVTTNAAFLGTINLGVSGLPPNATANLTPASVNGNDTVNLAVTLATNTPLGTYPLTIRGTNGTDVVSDTVELIVGLPPAGVAIWNGGSAAGDDWNDPDNWGGNALTPGSTLFFTGNTRLENNNDTLFGTLYSNIVFNPGAGAFILSGNYITLVGNITNLSANPQTVALGLLVSSNLVFNGATAPLILGGGLFNMQAPPAITRLTFEGTGVITNVLVSGAGGTNVLGLMHAAANWTLMDNASSATMIVPWVLSISNGTFTFGAADSAPTLTSTTVNGQPADHQIGMVSGAVATFNMVNGTFTTAARLNTATTAGATGIVNQVGGTLNIGSQFQGANGAGANEVSLVTVSGGTMTVGGGTGPFYVASRGNGTLTISGLGTVSAGKFDISRNAAGNTVSSAGVVNLDGGTLMVTSVTNISANQQTGGSPTARFNFNGGTLLAKPGAASAFFGGCTVTPVTPITAIVKGGGAFIDDGGNAITILEPLQHDSALGGTLDGGLLKFGPGTLTLTKISTYTGGTIVFDGTLALIGTASIGNSAFIALVGATTLDVSGRLDGALKLNSGQAFAGNGTVRGSLLANPGALVLPGESIGSLTVTGAVTLQGLTGMELNAALGTNDLIRSFAAIHYGGTLLWTNDAGTLGPGSSFKLFDAPAYDGSFSNIEPATPGPGLLWDTAELTVSGTLKVMAVAAQPRISSIVRAGTNLALTATNAVAGPFRILATTNLSTPLLEWQPIGSNAFDGSGNFSTNLPIDPGKPRSFYLLQMQ
jgi:autotransporter-associated beta strand protein